MRKKRVTLLDVAKHAGVSRATASLIVRGSPSVSDKTRRKVQESIRELGYVYDRVAANMRSDKSSTVGLIITDIANPYFAELLIGVHNKLAEFDYIEFLGTTFDSDETQELLLSKMLEHRVGGIILCPVSQTSEQTIKRIKNVDVPIVLAVREIPEIEADYVGIDYHAGAELSTTHLIQKGHNKIAFLGGASESSAFQERKKGYTAAMEQASLQVDPHHVVESPITREGGREAVRKMLQNEPVPTACICWNDLVALGVMEELRQQGYEIGKDMAVVGFDNIQEASMHQPPLTTVASHARLIGSQAANLLRQRMNDPERERQRVILQPDLVPRKTT
jgi:LacI family transcriptional regulator